MEVFSIGSSGKPVRVWGPTASVGVILEGLDGKGGKNDGIGGKNSDWLLEGAQVGASEIVDVRQCFNDVSYIYALGNDQGKCRISLSFVIFIGTMNCVGDNNLKAVKDGFMKYEANRISARKNMSPLGISIGAFSTKGWLVDVSIGQMDPARGICHGVLSYIMQLGV